MNFTKFFSAAAAGLFFMATAPMNAQNINCLSKGNFTIGTRLGLSTATNDVKIETNGASTTSGTASATQVNITPAIGYFFADKFLVGAAMEYTLQSSKDVNSSDKATDTKTLFGPWVRYYLPVGDDQAFFLGATSGFGRSTTTIQVENGSQNVTNNITTFGVGPGYSIFANNCVSLEAQAKYNFGNSKSEYTANGVSNTTKTFSNSFDIVVGVHYYFTRARG